MILNGKDLSKELLQEAGQEVGHQVLVKKQRKKDQ